jgi:hypothetical protein
MEEQLDTSSAAELTATDRHSSGAPHVTKPSRWQEVRQQNLHGLGMVGALQAAGGQLQSHQMVSAVDPVRFDSYSWMNQCIVYNVELDNNACSAASVCV